MLSTLTERSPAGCIQLGYRLYPKGNRRSLKNGYHPENSRAQHTPDPERKLSRHNTAGNLGALTATTKAEQRSAFKEYRRKLAPIQKRNPQPRAQEHITWQ